ncbi:FMN-binding negative transcriptional regulator [Actinomadura barringtoniae]|uniref:FMN-binding negative transcriptional regulator n=1 Tax=Actinomadura barringtoniae TaxID=1427535 RepID=A0A939T2G1_9ACTN|nr:FMN-binding negative transcriptional regulator [Actinomadura barringtoniae]MBO2449571.1 FMN-binding negative transcriptional regulator [Actinomadura barringtoniae]
MLEQDMYAVDDPEALRALIDANGWATMVSVGDDGRPVVSHLPILPDPAHPGVAIVGHLARQDGDHHRLGTREITIIVQGVNGYIPASFYQDGPYVSTWDFVVAHLSGTPEILGAEDTYQVLSDTIDHFEAPRPHPFKLSSVEDYAREIMPGTVGFRLVPTRIVGKAKLSQDKPAEIVDRIVDALKTDATHGDPDLAEAIRAANA